MATGEVSFEMEGINLEPVVVVVPSKVKQGLHVFVLVIELAGLGNEGSTSEWESDCCFVDSSDV